MVIRSENETVRLSLEAFDERVTLNRKMSRDARTSLFCIQSRKHKEGGRGEERRKREETCHAFWSALRVRMSVRFP